MPELKLYNTLTRQKEDFEPIDHKHVRMYVCGPTVYDFAHIGNARPVIVFDVLYRLLRHLYGESHVTYVRNITDLDDKINARALRDFGGQIKSGEMSLNAAIREVTGKTTNQFHADVKALGCLEPDIEPRATDYVLPSEDGKADMATMIQTLLDRDHAYIATGEQGREVLFRVNSMEDYGALSNRIGKLDEQVEGARVAVESHKENAADFVLWKESGETEPGWDATFNGEAIHGRPGWHIECSAMSAAHLDEVFDIHGGGLDLIFPHHENEIAQSRCTHGTDKMANVWMHNGYLQVEGRKMSKSEGNFVTIHDLLHTEKFGGRKWPGEVLRLAMLMTHYREPIDFSVKRLEEAEKNLIRFNELASHANKPSDELFSKIEKALLDDLNSAGLVAAMHELAGKAAHGEGSASADLLKTLDFLGLRAELATLKSSADDLAEDQLANIDQKITERIAYFKDKNYEEADRIRNELAEQGIQLKDGKDPETGERITTWELMR